MSVFRCDASPVSQLFIVPGKRGASDVGGTRVLYATVYTLAADGPGRWCLGWAVSTRVFAPGLQLVSALGEVGDECLHLNQIVLKLLQLRRI